MAPAATTLLGNMLDYYSTLAQDALKRANEAYAKIGKGQYGADDLVSDTLYGWSQLWESALGWAVPLQQSGGTIPTAFLKITPDQSAAAQEVAVAAPAKGDPESTALTQVGGGAKIDADKVATEFKDASRRVLAVRLVGLAAKLAEGLYQGVVTIDEVPLAIVLVLVKAP